MKTYIFLFLTCLAPATALAQGVERPSDELSATLRPFVTLEALGAGASGELSYTRRFGLPLALTAELTPAAFAFSDEGENGMFAAHGIVSYDTRFFQVGVGLGVACLEVEHGYGDSGPAPELVRMGISTAQFVRIGDVDDWSGQLTTYIVGIDEFDFGGLNARLQIPIHRYVSDTWVVVRGGGLRGHVYGEVGVRTMFDGDGGPGTVFLTPSIGGAGLTDPEYAECEWGGELCKESREMAGPTVGFTVEWRL